jgi:hypothetical protein
MALFILSIVGLLATAALLWCLAGFSRALKEKPEIIGLLVRVHNHESTSKRRKQMIIPFPDAGSLPRRSSAVRLQKYGSSNPLIVELFEMRGPRAS